MDPYSLDPDLRFRRLQPPVSEGRIDVVIDTDAYNEIDDQFAVVQALLSPERMNVEAIFAAPFLNERSESPADGMEKSYQEILQLLERLGRSAKGFAYRGSERFLKEADGPVESEAARRLIELAMHPAREAPLYVLAIGAPANVSSALLLEPRLAERIVVVWLGGNAPDWPNQREFNLKQDIPGSRVLFDSGVPLVQIPAMGAASHLLTTAESLDEHLKDKNAIAAFLCERFRAFRGNHFGYAKEIWDIAAPAYILDPSWTPSYLTASPIINDNSTLSIDAGRHPIRVVRHIDRNRVFIDLYRKIAQRG